MTLIITVISKFGAWQSSDHRLTQRLRSGILQTVDNNASKSVIISCTDGHMLVCYTGLARIGNKDCMVWLRQTLRGEGRTIDETIEHLRVKASADFGPLLERWNVPHVFQFAIFHRGQPYAGIVTNIEPATGRATRQFESLIVPATDVPKIMLHGCVDAVGEEDRQLLKKIAFVPPKRPKDFQLILAGINARAAQSGLPGSQAVSAECVTTYMPPTGVPFESIGHNPNNLPPNYDIAMQGHLMQGIDTTPMAELMVEMMRRMNENNPMSEEEMHRRQEEAGEESIRPPNS